MTVDPNVVWSAVCSKLRTQLSELRRPGLITAAMGHTSLGEISRLVLAVFGDGIGERIEQTLEILPASWKTADLR